MTTNAEKIQEWRTANPHAVLTEQVLKQVLDLPTLGGADLYGADLYGANLYGADLCGAYLYGAYLYGADLCGANLYNTDLRNANLCWANLCGARMHRANLEKACIPGMLYVTGLHPYPAFLTPTPHGWTLTIGCWTGTIPELRTLIAGDDWPEAEGDEITRRRPLLEALADMCEKHAAAHSNIIHELARKWNTKEPTNAQA